MRCSVCKRPLRSAASVALGMGRICAKKSNGGAGRTGLVSGWTDEQLRAKLSEAGFRGERDLLNTQKSAGDIVLPDGYSFKPLREKSGRGGSSYWLTIMHGRKKVGHVGMVKKVHYSTQ